MEKKLLDLETALERLGGDKEFLIELLQELLQQVEEELPKLKKAIEEQNYDEVRSRAHGLKGAAANLGADKAMEVFLKLEMMGKEQNLNGASEALQEAQQLNDELKAHITTI
jgi:HPt (histidine-containing phosphotransfer) domain-containing protein